jgi:hypothetical protein
MVKPVPENPVEAMHTVLSCLAVLGWVTVFGIKYFYIQASRY